MNTLPENAAHILDDLSFFDNWEDRYRYIIDLGKSLPKADDSIKNEQHLVRGCQSQVWLIATKKDNQYTFQVDSDAHIVKGLLAVVMAVYQKQTQEFILHFDIDDYFAKLGLIQHLSPTRGNGLKAMIQRIKTLAETL